MERAGRSFWAITISSISLSPFTVRHAVAYDMTLHDLFDFGSPGLELDYNIHNYATYIHDTIRYEMLF